MEIILRKEDLTTEYSDPRTCPMATALKKALNREDISFFGDRISSKGTILGYIEPAFMARNYKDLALGHIDSFITIFTPIL